MKPKRFAPPHIIRLYVEDEDKLGAMPGKTDSEKIRLIVHEYLKNISI